MDLVRTADADAGRSRVAGRRALYDGRSLPRAVGRANEPRSDKGHGDPNQDPDPPVLRID